MELDGNMLFGTHIIVTSKQGNKIGERVTQERDLFNGSISATGTPSPTQVQFGNGGSSLTIPVGILLGLGRPIVIPPGASLSNGLTTGWGFYVDVEDVPLV